MALAVSCCAALLAVPSLAAEAKKKVDPKREKQVKRGEYLVNGIGCGLCHTPKKMGPNGPEYDNSRLLMGQPAEPAVPAPPKLAPSPWMAAVTADMTAWAGPWGVSFSRNLTPDKETGLGEWSEQNFIDTMRTGKRMGKGRALLPPMPWDSFMYLNDDDLKAIFAYLQSIPALKNPVPEPVPPAPAK
ncbi:MAG: c-type cytochrome [Archangiaceae bacterium]|nr:c-type cytochrome [Archangiaceae bacterium]